MGRQPCSDVSLINHTTGVRSPAWCRCVLGVWASQAHNGNFVSYQQRFILISSQAVGTWSSPGYPGYCQRNRCDRAFPGCSICSEQLEALHFSRAKSRVLLTSTKTGTELYCQQALTAPLPLILRRIRVASCVCNRCTRLEQRESSDHKQKLSFDEPKYGKREEGK